VEALIPSALAPSRFQTGGCPSSFAFQEWTDGNRTRSRALSYRALPAQVADDGGPDPQPVAGPIPLRTGGRAPGGFIIQTGWPRAVLAPCHLPLRRTRTDSRDRSQQVGPSSAEDGGPDPQTVTRPTRLPTEGRPGGFIFPERRADYSKAMPLRARSG
jgi:hypothetical protein